MRYLIVVIFALLAGPLQAGEPLKLATWNLEWFPGGANATLEQAAAKCIKRKLPTAMPIMEFLVGRPIGG